MKISWLYVATFPCRTLPHSCTQAEQTLIISALHIPVPDWQSAFTCISVVVTRNVRLKTFWSMSSKPALALADFPSLERQLPVSTRPVSYRCSRPSRLGVEGMPSETTSQFHLLHFQLLSLVVDVGNRSSDCRSRVIIILRPLRNGSLPIMRLSLWVKLPEKAVGVKLSRA